MEEAKTLILRFTGDKKSLHKQLKMYCVEADKSMNGLVINLIKNYLKTKTNEKK